MPITNLAIQRRRLQELNHILGHGLSYIQPLHLNSIDGYQFTVKSLTVELAKHLEEADFEIIATTLVGDSLKIFVHSKTPEKDGCKKKTGVF